MCAFSGKVAWILMQGERVLSGRTQGIALPQARSCGRSPTRYRTTSVGPQGTWQQYGLRVAAAPGNGTHCLPEGLPLLGQLVLPRPPGCHMISPRPPKSSHRCVVALRAPRGAGLSGTGSSAEGVQSVTQGDSCVASDLPL